MIDVQTVIDYLTANTSYNIKVATDVLPNIQEVAALPEVYVGYSTIKAKDLHRPLELNVLNSNGENLVQSFEIHIVCPVAMFHSVWITVFKTLVTWNPEPTERMHTGFTYTEGGKMGSNVRFWHVDVYAVGFPTGLALR